MATSERRTAAINRRGLLRRAGVGAALSGAIGALFASGVAPVAADPASPQAPRPTGPDATNSSFQLDIQDVGSGVFSEVSGLGSQHDVTDVEQNNGDDKSPTIKQIGNVKYFDITLKRGLTNDQTFWKWRQTILQNGVQGNRKSGTITLLDDQGNTVAAFTFERGWPSAWHVTALQTDGGIVKEVLVITHEGLTRTV